MGFRALGHRQGATILFLGVFCAREASSWGPWAPLTPLWVSPGVLWVRSRCYFCVFGRPLDVGPVSVLFGVGRDVRSVHVCACFVRVRQVKEDSLFRLPWGTRAPIKEATLLHPESWIEEPGSRILDPGSWILGIGSRILDPGSRILDPECRILDLHVDRPVIKLLVT